MDQKTKVGMVLAIVAAGIGFVPSDEGSIVVLKAIAFPALVLYMYYLSAGQFLEKNVSILVADVREDRRDHYRKTLLQNFGSHGPAAPQRESRGEVAIGLKTRRSVEDLKKTADKSDLKIQYEEASVTLRYTSLEAEARMTVQISGRATPGSKVTIEGVAEAIPVGSSGAFTVEAPLALVEKHKERGFIPAKCTKGSLVDDIEIRL